jgi:protein SCO1/2
LYDVSGHLPNLRFSLQGAGDKTVTEKDFSGQTVLMFFGYASCPDICPTDLSIMAQAMNKLGDNAQKITPIFITVDPERDTQELLSQYVPAFDKRFLGLRPQSTEELEKITKDFKVFYKKVPGNSLTSYTIDHTAGSYVFDTKGQLRLFLKHQQGPNPIAEDLKKLL